MWSIVVVCGILAAAITALEFRWTKRKRRELDHKVALILASDEEFDRLIRGGREALDHIGDPELATPEIQREGPHSWCD